MPYQVTCCSMGEIINPNTVSDELILVINKNIELRIKKKEDSVIISLPTNNKLDIKNGKIIIENLEIEN